MKIMALKIFTIKTIIYWYTETVTSRNTTKHQHIKGIKKQGSQIKFSLSRPTF